MATAVAARPSAQSRYCGLSTRLVTMSPSTRASARSALAGPAVGGPASCEPAAGGGRRQARSAAAAKSTRTRASPAVQTATATSRPAVTTSIAPYWYTGGGPMPKARATMNGVAATDSTCKPPACCNARKAVAPPSWPVAASARTTRKDASTAQSRAAAPQQPADGKRGRYDVEPGVGQRSKQTRTDHPHRRAERALPPQQQREEHSRVGDENNADQAPHIPRVQPGDQQYDGGARGILPALVVHR